VENKTVEMVVKDLLLADNRKKKTSLVLTVKMVKNSVVYIFVIIHIS